MSPETQLNFDPDALETTVLSAQTFGLSEYSPDLARSISEVLCHNIDWESISMTPSFREREVNTQVGVSSLQDVRSAMSHEVRYLNQNGLPIEHVALSGCDVILVDEAEIDKLLGRESSSDLKYRLMALAASCNSCFVVNGDNQLPIYLESRRFRTGAARLASNELAERLAELSFPDDLQEGLRHRLDIYGNQIQLSEMKNPDTYLQVLGAYIDTELILRAAEASLHEKSLSLKEKICKTQNEFDSQIAPGRVEQRLSKISSFLNGAGIFLGYGGALISLANPNLGVSMLKIGLSSFGGKWLIDKLSLPFRLLRSRKRSQLDKSLLAVRAKAFCGEDFNWEEIPQQFQEFLTTIAGEVCNYAPDNNRPRIWVSHVKKDMPLLREALLRYEG